MYFNLQKIKLIGWDLDGTLYPKNLALDEEIAKKEVLAVAKHLECSTLEAQEKIVQIKKTLKSNTKTLEILGLNGKKFFIKVWDEIDLSKFIKSNPKLVSLFAKIGLNLPQALLPNSNSYQNIERKLNLIGLKSNQFKPIITSAETHCHKPDLKIFQIFIQKTGLDPSRILYVGDREEVDLVPAKKLGIQTCLVGSKTSITGADLSVVAPEELLEMFL